MKKRILIVDDHPLICEWLEQLINRQADLTVCGVADSAPRALQAAEELRPDCVVVDITLKRGSGIELLKDLKRLFSEMGLVVLTMHEEEVYAERAIRAGARAYVNKRTSTDNILSAIRGVLELGLYLSPELTSKIAEQALGGNAPEDAVSPQALSDREFDVFRKLGEGHETSEIAESLGVSLAVVQANCGRIKRKLGLRTFAEVRREAIRWSGGSGA